MRKRGQARRACTHLQQGVEVELLQWLRVCKQETPERSNACRCFPQVPIPRPCRSRPAPPCTRFHCRFPTARHRRCTYWACPGAPAAPWQALPLRPLAPASPSPATRSLSTPSPPTAAATAPAPVHVHIAGNGTSATRAQPQQMPSARAAMPSLFGCSRVRMFACSHLDTSVELHSTLHGGLELLQHALLLALLGVDVQLQVVHCRRYRAQLLWRAWAQIQHTVVSAKMSVDNTRAPTNNSSEAQPLQHHHRRREHEQGYGRDTPSQRTHRHRRRLQLTRAVPVARSIAAFACDSATERAVFAAAACTTQCNAHALTVGEVVMTLDLA